MSRMRMFVLLIFAVLLSGIAAMLPFVWSGARVLSSSYSEAAVRKLEGDARLFSRLLEAAGGEKGEHFEALARGAEDDTGARFTVILADGAVLADSEEDAGRMENHRNRPEIQTALAGGRGVEVRPSPTLGTDWMYVALPLADGTVVRAAASMDDLNESLSGWWKKALAGFGASLVVLLLLSLFLSRLLSRPIEAAALGAERYARGELSYRLPLAGCAETRRLSLSLGLMAEELNNRFNLVTRQREEMRTVFATMSEGVLAVGDDGRILLANDAARTFLALPPDVPDAPLEAIVRNASLQDAIRQTVASGDALEAEIQIPRDNEEDRLLHIHTARLPGGEGRNRNTNTANAGDVPAGVRGVLVVLRDITRLRQLEIMRRDFVANVSHELRTPITTIQNCLEITLDEDKGQEERNDDFLVMALRNIKRMGSIVDNLLFLAGMESGSGKETGKIGVQPIRPVIDEVAVLCREDADARKVTIRVDCDADLSARMNPQLIVHALTNLVDNAVKYGPEGGMIEIQARREADRVTLMVSDQGPGIPKRFHSRVFERFYRVDGVTRVKKGSGLGLAIVKHIALSQGGDIRLESDIGSGSSFTLSLPAHDAPEPLP